MISLNNGVIRLDIDDNARLTYFENLKNSHGNLIIDPKPLFRLNLHTGTDYEDMAFGELQEPSVSLTDGIAVIRLDHIRSRIADSAVSLELRVSLDGDRVRFGASMKNYSESTVAELYYPCIGLMNKLDDGRTDLLWPNQLGERIMDLENHLLKMKTREALHTLRGNYPGPLSMSWMMLTGRETCMYFCNEDPKLHVSSLRACGTDKGGFSLELDKMCFVEPGQTFEFPETVVRLYTGSWMEGADEYAAYASTWRRPIKHKDWTRRMNGYFLVINRQQYGDEIWPYDTLPELYELAKAHGYDTIGLFGWYKTGHDNNYPDLEVSESMGGEEELKKNIKAVQADGGHVTLYYQGHLMDVNSSFYKKLGYKLEGRTLYNNPYYEFYPKACNSDFARTFSRRVFATVCPSCTEWHQLMANRIDWIASFGADGTLYDQIGGMPPYPCFNKEHPHMDGRPSLSYTQGRLKLHKKIREHVADHDDFAFFSEHVTDAYSQFLDCVHGIGASPSAQISEKTGKAQAASDPGVGTASYGIGRSAGMGSAAGRRMMPQMFRYCFPETNVTVRNPQPTTDQRLASYAFVFGLKLEMELRYLTDREDIERDFEPEKRIYSKAVSDLRREYEKYLLLGSFRAEEGITNPYITLFAERFVAEDGTAAIALWNDSKESRSTAELKFEGTAKCWATVSAKGDGMIAELAPGEIAIVLLDD